MSQVRILSSPLYEHTSKKILELKPQTAICFWVALVLIQIVLISLAVSIALAISISVVGWFGAIFYIAAFIKLKLGAVAQ